MGANILYYEEKSALTEEQLMKRTFCVLSCLTALLVSLTACVPSEPPAGIDPPLIDPSVIVPPQTELTPESGTSTAPVLDYSVSARDTDASYDTVTGTAVFTDSGVTVTGGGIQVNGTTITVTAEGTYILSGDCKNGAIVVNAPKDHKIQLVLNGLNLTAKSGAPLHISQADKVFVTLADGSVNTLSDTGASSDTSVDGAIFSKEDLTINGNGALTVNGNYKHGIVSKDDLVITGGTVSVSAASTGMDGKDCVKITGGTVTVNAKKNGIRSTNEEDAALGYVWIGGGTVSVDAGNDGLECISNLKLDGGSITVKTGGGSGRKLSSNASSAKGLKCDGDILVSGGTFSLDTADDAIHASGNIYLQSGTLSIKTGDDAIHADAALEISGSITDIVKSYEGLEATDLRITGGVTAILSSEDGINAAGGNDNNSPWNGRPGGDRFAGSSATVEISGGYLFINASGDGIDSNGTIAISGGTVLISGPTNNGNGALDYDGQCSVTGGVLIACGAAGMAQNVSDGTQGALMTNTTAQPAGTTIALCNADGVAIVAFTSPKTFNNVVISAPGVLEGETYTLISCTVEATDDFGLAQNVPVTPKKDLAEIKMTSLIYGVRGGMGGGPGGGRPQGPGGRW